MSFIREFLYKPRTLKEIVQEVEETAVKNGVWGINLETLVLTTKIIQDNSWRLNQIRFSESNQQSILLLPFGNLEDAIAFLKDIRIMVETAVHSKDKLFEVMKGMHFPTRGEDVRFKQLVTNKRGYSHDIAKYVAILIKEVTAISEAMVHLSNDILVTIRSRCSGVINGLLVINELIIEDIIFE